MCEHFSQSRLSELAEIVSNLLEYSPQNRAVLLGGLPSTFKGTLPGGAGGAPLVVLRLDLDALNRVERLQNGIVPIKQWLENALSLIGTVADADPIREALADVETKMTGSPRIAVVEHNLEKEKILFRDDMVPVGFLEGGLTAARAVAKLTVPRYDGDAAKTTATGAPVVYLGTGWLLARGLLLTNHHVINARNEGEAAAGEADLHKQAAKTVVLFDYDGDGLVGAAVDVVELVAWDVVLDYAVLRLADASRAPLTWAPQAIGAIDRDTAIAVNVIQHPDGKPKKLGIRNNLVTAATPTELRYFTDTLEGSSGSPVLNDRWQVVALHRGSAFVRGIKFQGRDVTYVNVGTQLPAIMADLRQRYAGRITELEI